MRRHFLFSIFTAMVLISEAQTVLNVATQRFQEEVPYQSGQVFVLDLEKAQATVTGWDRNYFALEILMKSRHKDRDQAITELSYLKYELDQSGDTIRFDNDFVSGKEFRKVQGILNIELSVKAPYASQLLIANAYGTTEVSNMSGPVHLDGKFVETQVSNCQGPVWLTAVFGSNKIDNQKGELNIDLSRVDLTGSQIKGKVSGTASYGNVYLMGLSSPEVNIEARITSFTIALNAPIDNYHYDLSTDLGTIFLEGSMELKKSSKWEYEGTSESKISIITSFSPIIIRDNTLNAYKQ